MSASSAQPAAPRGIAKAEADRKAAEDREAEARIARLQTEAARQRRLEKAARKDPALRNLVEEYNAIDAALETLRKTHAELSAEFERVAKEKAALQVERDEQGRRAVELFDEVKRLQEVERQLGQDLEAARSDAGKARAELAKLKDAKESKKS